MQLELKGPVAPVAASPSDLGAGLPPPSAPRNRRPLTLEELSEALLQLPVADSTASSVHWPQIPRVRAPRPGGGMLPDRVLRPQFRMQLVGNTDTFDQMWLYDGPLHLTDRELSASGSHAEFGTWMREHLGRTCIAVYVTRAVGPRLHVQVFARGSG
jgi:hypothetical protein